MTIADVVTFFIITLAYLSLAIFLTGTAYRIYLYARTPVPFNITLTPGPKTPTTPPSTPSPTTAPPTALHTRMLVYSLFCWAVISVMYWPCQIPTCTVTVRSLGKDTAGNN